MTTPIRIDLPHNLGTEEAKRRMREGSDKLAGYIPGGADVQSRWDGDTMLLDVSAMGQQVSARLGVEPTRVRLEVALPAFLSLFADKIAAKLRKKGAELLEDKSKG